MDVAEVVVATSVEVWHGDEGDEDMMMMTVDLLWGVAFGGGDVDGGSMMLMGVSAGGCGGDVGGCYCHGRYDGCRRNLAGKGERRRKYFWEEERMKMRLDIHYRTKMKLNQTKLSTDLERARKTEAKGSKGLKTELKRKFPDRLDDVCAINEVKTKSKSTPEYGIGKGI
ncbi:hypothetical protein Tco_0008282 [Tanacetum coccineum]